MFSSVFSYGVETGRIAPWMALRNSPFDPVFYGVPSLSREERGEIWRAAASGEYHEGGMLMVWPAADRQPIEYFSLSSALCETYPKLDAVAVPGVGSSPLGSAALARQVADVIGRPVAGIIAGQGLADLCSEALGGWFYFGTRNRVLSALRYWRAALGTNADERAMALKKKWNLMSPTGAEDEPDVNTVLNIMLRQGDKLRLLVGHSKGAMVVQNACLYFEREQPPGSNDLGYVHIVTFGCGIALPAGTRFTRVSQYVGSIDILGWVNTPYTMHDDPRLEWVLLRGHNLASWNPIHMPLDEKLR